MRAEDPDRTFAELELAIFESVDRERISRGLAALDDIRKRQGLAPLLPVDDIHETAQAFARAKSEGRPVGTVPAGYGETLVHFYAGPGLDEIVSTGAKKSGSGRTSRSGLFLLELF